MRHNASALLKDHAHRGHAIGGGKMALAEMELDEGRFVELLGKLVGECKLLQNNPPEHVPVEDRGERV